MAVDVSKIPNNSKFDPVREAILKLQKDVTEGVAGVATVNSSDGNITITNSGNITVGTSGETITIGIDDSTYLTEEVNDLTSAVTWDNVPDANITESSVTQHEAALSITESQISDLGNYLDLDDTGEQTIAGDIVISGDLTISGTTTYINTNHLNIGDNIIQLNADILSTTAPTDDAGFYVNRGSSPDVSFLWDEQDDRFSTYASALSTASLYIGSNQVINSSRQFLGSSTISSTVPYFTFSGDSNTGVGRATNNKVSLIAEGVKSLEASDTLVDIPVDLNVDGSITVNGTDVYDNLPTGDIVWSDTDNKFKLGVDLNTGGSATQNIQPLLLANLLSEGYVPYVDTGDAGSSTVNSKVSDSWLKINSNTLELDWDTGSPGVYAERNLKMRKDGGGFGTYYEATYAADSVSFLHYASASDIDTAKVGATSTGRVRINDTYNLPAGDGTSGQVLTTNGSGDLSWAAAGGSTTSDLQDVTDNGASTSNTVTFTGGSTTTPAVYVKSGGNSWSEGLVIHPAANNSWNGIYFSESATIGTQTGVWFVGNSGETGYVNDFYILKRDSNYGSALGNTTAALRINKADGSLHSHSHTVNGQLFLNRSNGTINSANSAIQIENPTGTQSMIYFDFATSHRGSIRVDSSGNMVFNALAGDFYFNNDFGTGGVVDLINTNTTFLSATSGGNVNIPVTLTATTMFTSNTITTSASSGSVLLKHNVSEANSWIFQENAGNWGLFWLNDGNESGQTIGTYATVGAEVFGMNNAVTGFNPSSAWSGTNANSRAAWMLSNYSGDFWSQGRQYSENSMVSPIYYDTDTAYYLDANSHSNIGSIRINRNWNTSGVHPEQLTVRGTYASMALRSTTQNANWLFHNDGSFRLYSDSATDGNNWVEQFRVDQNGVATITRGRLNIEGTDGTPIKITGASHKYLTINPGNGYEAMVRYIGGSGYSWYVGKRTSGQLIGTDNFHFYSEAAGATVGGINTSGDLLTIGSVQSPTFYDSNNTGYYADPAGTSNFNALNVSLINNIAPDRNVLGKRVSYSSLSGSSGDWFPLLQVTDSNGPVYASVSTYAHSSVAFTCSGGYGPSNQPSLTVLNSTWNPNGGFANVNGIRIRQDGWVEIRLSWGSGPTVDIDVQAWDAAGSVVTFAGSLATTTATNAIKMTVDQFPTGMLAANYIYGQVQMQSPIYYDFDNTAYYVDPASQTTIRKTNIIASGSGWDDGLNLYSSDTANRWNILVDDGAGDWLRFAYNNSEKIRVETNGVATFLNDLYSSYSMRAQTFYDTNNTTYFLNPDSTGTSLHIAGSVEAATYYKPGLLLNSSGTGSSGAALGMQQVTGEGWTGIFVDYEPYTGWGLYHDNPNNYFCITAEGSTGNLRSFTVPSRTSGNRTAYEKIRFDQNNGSIIAGGSVYAQSSIYASYFGDYQTNFIFRTGSNTGTTRHINLANTTSDPSVALGTGISWGQRTDGQPYYIIRTILDNYNGNYTKLNLNWHTGINIGANPQYGGVRFYSDAFGISSTVVASIASGDNNMRSNYDIIAYASDKRLKTNVEPITNAVDKVKSLTGMTYNWNEVGNDYGWEAPKERESGVFAQDVQAVLPEAVRLAPFDHSVDEDGNPVSKSGKDFLTVKYEKLVPLLIEAIKEQQDQIDELKSIINTLKS